MVRQFTFLEETFRCKMDMLQNLNKDTLSGVVELINLQQEQVRKPGRKCEPSHFSINFLLMVLPLLAAVLASQSARCGVRNFVQGQRPT